MNAAKHTPWLWKVSQINQAVSRFVVYRDTDKGIEFMATKSGFPREFSTEQRARAAITKATGGAK